MKERIDRIHAKIREHVAQRSFEWLTLNVDVLLAALDQREKLLEKGRRAAASLKRCAVDLKVGPSVYYDGIAEEFLTFIEECEAQS